MNRDYTRTVFDNIDWDNVPEDPDGCPTTVNGSGVFIDLSSPVDFIEDTGRVVLNDNDDFDLEGTLAWNLAMGMDNPLTVPAADLTNDQMADAGFWVGANITRFNIHQIASNAGVPITVRNSDVVHRADMGRFLNNNQNYYLTQGRRLWNYLKSDSKAMEGVTCNRTHVGRSLVATANHRDTEEGHSWYTDKQTTVGSSTKKHLGVAGSHVDAFAEFMLKAGHDIWHYLDDATLRALAYLFCAMCPERVNAVGNTTDSFVHPDGLTDMDKFGDLTTDSKGAKFRERGPVVLYDFMFMGKLHETIPVTAVMDVGQAALDRFPHGTLGVSSLITGCSMVTTMLGSIASKVKLDGVQSIITQFANIATIAEDSNVERVTIMALRSAVGKSIRIAYGYCNGIPELKELANAYVSLVNFARQTPAEVATGATLAGRVRELTADPDAVSEAIKSAFATVTTAIAAVDTSDAIDTTEMTLTEVDVPEVTLYRNANQVDEEIQRRTKANQLERI